MTEPLIVRRFDYSVEPDRDCGETEMLVCCVAEDGRPVALLLDDEARAKLGRWVGCDCEQGKGTGTTGEPTRTAGIADERALRLADHILNTGGVWTSGKAHHWLSRNASQVPSARFTRRVLKALAVHGYLTERHEPGRVSYTPNYVKDGGR